MSEKKSFWDSGFGRFVDSLLFGLPSAIAGWIGSSRLTGAEREQNAFNAQQAQLNRDFEAAQVQQQMDFQSRMANTQWQRGVQDMQAAGLNPALAYNQGGAVAPSGAAAAGSLAQGSGRGIPMTMSDILSAMRLKKEMQLLESQAKNTDADTDLKKSQKSGLDIENASKPAVIASQLKINEREAERISAATRELLASADGQEILNSWRPALFANEIASGEVSRQQGLAAIVRIQSELGVLDAQRRSYEADITLKAAQRVLNLAQASLVAAQEEGVRLDNWRKDFANRFQEEFGTQPDEPIWNAIVGVLGKAAHDSGGSIESFLRNAKEQGPSLFDGLDILGKKVIDNLTDKKEDFGNKLQYFKFKYLD